MFQNSIKEKLSLLLLIWSIVYPPKHNNNSLKPVETPIEQRHKHGESIEDVVLDRKSYQRLVRKLIYLSHTRPIIAYVVGIVSQLMHSPKETHLIVFYST